MLLHVSPGIKVTTNELFKGGLPVTPSTGQGVDLGTETLVPIWIYLIPAGENITIPFKLLAPFSGPDVTFSAEVFQREDRFSMTGDFTFIPQTATLLAQAEIDEALKEAGVPRAAAAHDHQPEFRTMDRAANFDSSFVNSSKNGCPPNWEYDPVTVQSCQDQVEQNTKDDMKDLHSALNPFEVGGHYMLDLLSEIEGSLGRAGEAAGGVMAFFTIREAAEAANRIIDRHRATRVESLDPNDISGPSGFGSSRWVSGGGPLAYGLFFTNEKTAASARDVVISDPLDKATLDINSLILGPISLGDQQVVPPSVPLSALGSFSADIDLRPAQDLIARLTSSLDISTGVLTWHFESIDPGTGQPPTDPFLGFLLPGAEGSVTFSIKAKPGTLTGTTISQEGTVFFDGKPLDTPVWFNTVDNTPPVSHVGTLAAKESTSCFRPQWTGADSGAGLQSFNLFVSDNSGPFSAWLEGTNASNALFKGEAGHSYAFYSVATDFVGNIEPGKTAAEAITTVAPGASCNGRPSISAMVLSKSASGETETLSVQFTNNGIGNAQLVDIQQIRFRTLLGTGVVILASPLPDELGTIAAGASKTVTLKLTVPLSAKEFSITEEGTLQDVNGEVYAFSVGQAVFQ